eukprot:CAMPEP_0194310808 /NCGR_PEP_ID=MMETSP0171-20130528/7794_1 /TAXON_ID=218684 /ORGANISM="Corethron pennatum, Strain L29A3" /LENGTH=141 /DNA_ID=CAMNT_0039064627 /DNA_START=166 /DNA_END=591 /DNA_ORIENTATION=-
MSASSFRRVLLSVALSFLIRSASSFHAPAALTPARTGRAPTELFSRPVVRGTRAEFVRAVLSVVAAAPLAVAPPAWAKGENASVAGTKSDPKYQACASTCMYECTKPKADEQKTRAECLPECKVKCATTKQQLIMGVPKKD